MNKIHPIIKDLYKTILIHEGIEYRFRSLEHISSVFDRLGTPSNFTLMARAGYVVNIESGQVLKDRYKGVQENATTTAL